MLPHCASVTNFVQPGRTHFNFVLRLYRRSRRNWWERESLEKSGGQGRLAWKGLVSAVKGKEEEGEEEALAESAALRRRPRRVRMADIAVGWQRKREVEGEGEVEVEGWISSLGQGREFDEDWMELVRFPSNAGLPLPPSLPPSRPPPSARTALRRALMGQVPSRSSTKIPSVPKI